MFKGAYVALVTPFKYNAIDIDALHHLVDWHIEQGTDGLVICGCTGEGFCLTPEEQKGILQTVMEATKERIPIIASASSITPEVTLQLLHQAETLGADGVMVLTPPIVKPSQEALYDYFKYLNDQSTLPIIVYDNPQRTGTGIKNETVVQFSQLENIVALKDSSGDIGRLAELIPQLPQDFTVLSGDDFTTAGSYAYGVQGAISVTGNIAPRLMAEYWQTWQQEDITRFLELGRILTPLHKASFCEASPAPCKYGLSLLGLCRNEVRAPLHAVTPTGAHHVEEAMTWAGLIKTKKPSHG